MITDETTPFTIGKAAWSRGAGTARCWPAGPWSMRPWWPPRRWAAQGISLTVVDLHTIKPLDEAAIQEAARSCGALVTAEEHQLAGGLFGAVSEVVVRTCPVAHGGCGRPGHLWGERSPRGPAGPVRPERRRHCPGGPPLSGPEGVRRP